MGATSNLSLLNNSENLLVLLMTVMNMSQVLTLVQFTQIMSILELVTDLIPEVTIQALHITEILLQQLGFKQFRCLKDPQFQVQH